MRWRETFVDMVWGTRAKWLKIIINLCAGCSTRSAAFQWIRACCVLVVNGYQKEPHFTWIESKTLHFHIDGWLSSFQWCIRFFLLIRWIRFQEKYLSTVLHWLELTLNTWTHISAFIERGWCELHSFEPEASTNAVFAAKKRVVLDGGGENVTTR